MLRKSKECCEKWLKLGLYEYSTASNYIVISDYSIYVGTISICHDIGVVGVSDHVVDADKTVDISITQ